MVVLVWQSSSLPVNTHYPSPPPNLYGLGPRPVQSWKVEGLATRIVQSAFSDNLDCPRVGLVLAGQDKWVSTLTGCSHWPMESVLFLTALPMLILASILRATNESLKVNITSGER